MIEESTIIQKFLDYLKYERRFSEHTAKCYGADLAQYGEFLYGTPEDGQSEGESISFDHSGPATAVATHTRGTSHWKAMPSNSACWPLHA